jgi:hypothetical protein
MSAFGKSASGRVAAQICRLHVSDEGLLHIAFNVFFAHAITFCALHLSETEVVFGLSVVFSSHGAMPANPANSPPPVIAA